MGARNEGGAHGITGGTVEGWSHGRMSDLLEGWVHGRMVTLMEAGANWKLGHCRWVGTRKDIDTVGK